MERVNVLERELQNAYFTGGNTKIQNIWYEIYNDDFILRDAMKKVIVKDSNYQNVTGVNCPFIVNLVLNNYTNISKYTYSELVETVFSSSYIARLNITGKTFLELILTNDKLKLDEEKKSFSVRESLTVYKPYNRGKNLYSPLYNRNPFDIRYLILMNKSFNNEEKKELISLFYKDDYEFYNNLNTWEEQLASSVCNGMYPQILLYNIPYDEISNYSNSIKEAKRSWNKIVLHKFLRDNPPSVYKYNSKEKQKRLEKVK